MVKASLTEWLEFQQSLHPKDMELGLARVREVAQRLLLPPQTALRVLVAGTNGKGSSIAMLESIYRSAGYHVGCYTSPHLFDYCERVRINGSRVSEQDFCAAFEKVEAVRGETPLTYFEYGTLAAMQIMAAQPLDLQLLEVGLGGRLDAVNIIDGDLALLTQIDLDHCEWLGDTRELIGKEKAGIMRPGQPAICADRQAPHTVIDYADQVGAPLSLLGEQFDFSTAEIADEWHWQGGGMAITLPVPGLKGSNQLDNAAGVLEVTRLMQSRLPVSVAAIAQGLRNTQLAGRFESLPGRPAVIVDVAHNPQACHSLADNLSNLPLSGKRIAVLAMLADKNISGCMRPLMGLVDHWCLATLKEARGATANHLHQQLSALDEQVPVTLHDSVRQAVTHARQMARENDQLVVYGSFHTVAAAR
ncbi:MAG: bifunctional tetrahydrofolate synthase/dihydrofolate synthase [Gammaproteobacteria bacterium]